MKTEVIEKKDDKATGQHNANPVTEENKNARFVAGNPVNKDSAKPAEVTKAEPVKPESAKPEPAPQAQPQPEVAKVTEPKKTVLNLEGTLKLVEELHRRKIQRDKLLETINNLDAFEVELKDEVDETDGNYYQGCVLTIEDDTRRKFVTKNPTIIWTVAQMVNSLCVNKLAEIEATLTLPQA